MHKNKVLDYLKENKMATLGDIYIKFHLMNKGNEFLEKGDKPISAKEIQIILEELKKDNKIKSIIEDGNTFYILNE